jgi:hypothetical protein
VLLHDNESCEESGQLSCVYPGQGARQPNKRSVGISQPKLAVMWRGTQVAASPLFIGENQVSYRMQTMLDSLCRNVHSVELAALLS